MALIRQDAIAESSQHPKPESMAMMDEYMTPLAAAGTILGGQGLKGSAKGTRVRRMAKQRFVVDGPFAESKELVGGYLIVQARSLDEAVDLIRPWLRIHRIGQGVPSSAIEVRRLT
ncbi:MAG: YciI family protein [Deltaproteobacteria bacterium]|nr:YciI family protein [Deltaproteobacteria bacterium]